MQRRQPGAGDERLAIERMLADHVVAAAPQAREKRVERALHGGRLVTPIAPQQHEPAPRARIDVDRLDRNTGYRRARSRIHDHVVPAVAKAAREVTKEVLVAVRVRVGKRRDERRDDADAQAVTEAFTHSCRNSRRSDSLRS